MSLYYKILQDYLERNTGKTVDFTPQFQIIGSTRSPRNTNALAMRTADPLWMLGRQWQFGEFQGEDNGSPINVRASYYKEKIQYYSAINAEDSKSSARHALNNIPLEARVEAITMKRLDLKTRVRIGKQFERFIIQEFSQTKSKEFINNLRLAFQFDQANDEDKLDSKSAQFLNFMKGKVIDGGSLISEIKENNFPQEASYQQFSALDKTAKQLQLWYDKLFVEETPETSTWEPSELAHKFNVHLKDQNQADDATLTAPDYQSGQLDWYSFDKADVSLVLDKDKFTTTDGSIPVNVSFASMPDKRLFSFEDSRLDLSKMDVDPSDILKLMLIDFSLVSGSDWYTIPLEMEPGELCWIDSIEVEDVFGVTTTINNDINNDTIVNKNPLKVWDVFKIRDKSVKKYIKEDHFLFIPPVATFNMESEPIEELLFLRDEAANMVWGIEKIISNALGKPREGYDLHLEVNGSFLHSSDEEKESTKTAFRLVSTVPSNWIPYLPTRIDNEQHQVKLTQVSMPESKITPLTYLANEIKENIREETIPRAGVRVQITRQRVRSSDGKTHVWTGRKILAGKGEGSSGLIFDYLTDEE